MIRVTAWALLIVVGDVGLLLLLSLLALYLAFYTGDFGWAPRAVLL